MLSYTLKYGNVTVYQWKHGQAPVPAARNGNGTEEHGTGTEEAVGIDWGGLEGAGTVSRQDDGIDFGEIAFGEAAMEEDLAAVITLDGEGEGVVLLEEGGVAPPEQPPQVEESTEYSGKLIVPMGFPLIFLAWRSN